MYIMNGCIYISHRDIHWKFLPQIICLKCSYTFTFKTHNSEPVTLSHCYKVQTIPGKVFISQLVHV